MKVDTQFSIYRVDPNKFMSITEIKNRSEEKRAKENCTIEEVPGKEYTYKVTPNTADCYLYFMVGTRQSGKGESIASIKTPNKVTISCVKANAKKKITVKWNKAENANRYQIAVSRSKSFKSGVAIYNADANTIEKVIELKQSGKYFIKI